MKVGTIAALFAVAAASDHVMFDDSLLLEMSDEERDAVFAQLDANDEKFAAEAPVADQTTVAQKEEPKVEQEVKLGKLTAKETDELE